MDVKEFWTSQYIFKVLFDISNSLKNFSEEFLTNMRKIKLTKDFIFEPIETGLEIYSQIFV